MSKFLDAYHDYERKCVEAGKIQDPDERQAAYDSAEQIRAELVAAEKARARKEDERPDALKIESKELNAEQECLADMLLSGGPVPIGSELANIPPSGHVFDDHDRASLASYLRRIAAEIRRSNERNLKKLLLPILNSAGDGRYSLLIEGMESLTDAQKDRCSSVWRLWPDSANPIQFDVPGVREQVAKDIESLASRFHRQTEQSGEAEQQPIDIQKLERETPKLDTESGGWIRACEKNKEIFGIEISTLNGYRKKGSGGRATDDGMFGEDKFGRVWRHKETRNSNAFYLKSSLPKTGG